MLIVSELHVNIEDLCVPNEMSYDPAKEVCNFCHKLRQPGSKAFN